MRVEAPVVASKNDMQSSLNTFSKVNFNSNSSMHSRNSIDSLADPSERVKVKPLNENEFGTPGRLSAPIDTLKLCPNCAALNLVKSSDG